MPNWCSTTYKCVGDLKEVRSLYAILKKMNRRKNPKIRNGFGNMWLGELVNELGYDCEKYRCRGEIMGFELEEGILTIWQDTAWVEQEGVRKAIEERFTSIKVYVCDEEPGCEVYWTNDLEGIYFPDRYFLDCCGESTYFTTIEEAAKCVESLVGHEVEASVSAIERALDDYAEVRQENDEDVFYSFHEFTRSED